MESVLSTFSRVIRFFLPSHLVSPFALISATLLLIYRSFILELGHLRDLRTDFFFSEYGLPFIFLMVSFDEHNPFKFDKV